jgi:uncharacterized lipoprotein YmbA
MNLPGSDTPPTSRYLLTGQQQRCETGAEALSLSVVSVSAGLDNDRIARRDAASGELSYLKGVRWADQLGPLLEQQLAGDLECRGFTVMSGHHHKLGQARLICEVRAFNLLRDGGDRAEAWLSCVLARGDEDRSVVSRHSTQLARWRADDAVAALSEAYRAVLNDIAEGLR